MRERLIAVLTGCALALTGCGTADRETILVSAAASLGDVFAVLGESFEATHPGVEVLLNVAGSSTLREQILEGAPADVFAAADTVTMDRVVAAGRAAMAPVVVARNRMQIAVPRGNPGGVRGLEEFAREDLLLGLCAVAVPCGALARRVLAKAGVEAAIDTEEPDVRSLLTKIEAGELDAGIVYVTDVTARAGRVEGIAIDPAVNVTNACPVVTLTEAPNPGGAAAFVAFVEAGAARALFAQHGFAAP